MRKLGPRVTPGNLRFRRTAEPKMKASPTAMGNSRSARRSVSSTSALMASRVEKRWPFPRVYAEHRKVSPNVHAFSTRTLCPFFHLIPFPLNLLPTRNLHTVSAHPLPIGNRAALYPSGIRTTYRLPDLGLGLLVPRCSDWSREISLSHTTERLIAPATYPPVL